MTALINSERTIPKSEWAGIKYSITSREKQMLELLARGFSYRMIAMEVSISPQTVKVHLKRAYQKLQVESGTHAVAKAVWERIIDFD